MSKSGRRVRIFSALEVANICGVVNQTAINWIKNGHLKAFTTPGGQYRIYAKDFAAFLKEREMSDSEAALQIILENASWHTFLVIHEDEAINDKLCERIQKQFAGCEVVLACNAFDVGRKIIEAKPGFILVSGDVPGLDPEYFITTVKDDPAFGKPYVFLLQSGSPDSANPPFGADAVFVNPPEVDKVVKAIVKLGKQIDNALSA
jgi:excisionase family DNA binding protein